VIPRDYITEWRAHAPWVQDFQVEQDLVISRALAEIFAHPLLRSSLAFRGGTALYKLYITPPPRYSEDIDLVQVNAEPIGPVMDALRATLDPWLGKPQWKQTEGRVALNYRFGSEDTPPLRLRLKVEINSREHFALFERASVPFTVSSRWYTGSADISTYHFDELLGTKLRALYQRRKGRDLFDLAIALKNPGVDPRGSSKHFSVTWRRKRAGLAVRCSSATSRLRSRCGSSPRTSDQCWRPAMSGKWYARWARCPLA
jgi:predicted nucleotidyltransferase component of viral defense system